MQIEAGQAHAPRAGAMVEIVQFADGRLELSWRGQILRHRAWGWHEHLKGGKTVDAKAINDRVDAIVLKERRRLARLAAQIEHQDAQRRAGIYMPDGGAGAPRVAAQRYGLRPARSAATQSP